MCRLLVVSLCLWSVSIAGLAGSALAGGTQVEVVAVAGDIWVTTGFDVVKLKVATGEVMRRNRTRYPFPIDIGVSDGNVWVSSVENGFVSGALTRIPFEAGRVTQPLVFPSRPILALAVGSGTTWALVGPWGSLQLAAVDQATRSARLGPIRRDVGWIAADNVGETPGLFGVAKGGQAIKIAANGEAAWVAKTDAIQGPPVVGLGKVWVASRTGLYRLDAAGGQVEAKTPIRGAAAELAIGGGYVWVVSFRETKNGELYKLFKIDPRTARVVRQARLAGPVGSISFGSGALWLGRALPSVSVMRIDPASLRTRLFAKNLG
jgi:outer membrane protein assembly factor BamB